MNKEGNYKKNFIWNAIGVFTISLTTFIYSFVLTRFCSLSITGIWSYAFALACTLVTFASFGGRTFQVTDAKNELPTYTYISSRYFTVGIFILFLIIYLYIKDLNIEKFLIILLVCIFKFFEELSDVYYGILQRHDKLYIVGQSMFFKSIVNILLFLMSIILSKSLLLAVILLLINNFIFFLFFDRRLAIKEEKIKREIKKEYYKKYFKNNLIICLILFLSTYLVNCPKYFIASLLSDEIQGIFNILILPATALTLIGTFLTNPILVDISNNYKTGKIKRIKRISINIIFIILLFGFVGLIFAYFLGIPLYQWILKFDLSLYLKDLIIIIWGCVFYTISIVLTSILITFRKLISQLIINLIIFIVSFPVCYMLIKNYNIYGASWAFTLIMFIKCVFYIVLIICIREDNYEKK